MTITAKQYFASLLEAAIPAAIIGGLLHQIAGFGVAGFFILTILFTFNR